MLDILKQRMEQLRDKAEATAANMLPNKVPDHIQQARYDICSSCEHLYKPTDTCKKCGCFMKVKSWMPKQSCPVKKWDIYLEER